MSYTKLTDFAAKDALLSGNPSKLVRGTELGAEFDAIAVADALNIKPDTVTAATGKTTPVDADLLTLFDSASTFSLKKLTWANLKATLKTYFDTLYAVTGSYAASGANSDITSLASPALGAATATTQATSDSSTKVATTAFVRQFRQLVQTVTSSTVAVATGTTVVPRDDTIPQNTEGDQYLSLSITPTNASSTLEIEVLAYLSSSTSTISITAALFQDSTGNALLADNQIAPYATQLNVVALRHVMTAGTTSSTTFKFRAGPDSAATLTLNGSSGARLLGGVMSSRITIKEYLP